MITPTERKRLRELAEDLRYSDSFVGQSMRGYIPHLLDLVEELERKLKTTKIKLEIRDFEAAKETIEVALQKLRGEE